MKPSIQPVSSFRQPSWVKKARSLGRYIRSLRYAKRAGAYEPMESAGEKGFPRKPVAGKKQRP